MYSSRLKFIVGIAAFFALICAGRLFYLQAMQCGSSRDYIAGWEVGTPKTLHTVRGAIRDRRGREVAVDRAVFQLEIQYDLTRLMDDRFWRANEMIKAKSDGFSPELQKDNPEMALELLAKARQKLSDRFETDIDHLNRIIDTVVEIGAASRQEVLDNITEINDFWWRKRRYFAWKRNCIDSNSFSEYETLIPDPQRRLMLEGYVNDLAEMQYEWYDIASLDDETQKLAAEERFADWADQVRIEAKGRRYYPYGAAACQVIGWVSSPREPEISIFEEDQFSSYIAQDSAGFRGVEKACEPILRGRRGRVLRSVDGEILEKQDIVLGKNVDITIDIELQSRIEKLLDDESVNPVPHKPVGAVLIDVASGDILCMVSRPTFDLNDIRANYDTILNDPNVPMDSRAVYRLFPPGSSIKPLIALIAMAEHKLTPHSVISCPYIQAGSRSSWPRCWIQRSPYHASHDAQWSQYGQSNNARNAIRGSCNVYFSKAADMVDARRLQYWLYQSGFGHEILPGPDFENEVIHKIDISQFAGRNIRQSAGCIDNARGSHGPVKSFQDIPGLTRGEKRYFGIGQGNCRVTVLQIANAMAMIARGGVYKKPRLIIANSDLKNDNGSHESGFSRSAVDSIWDGMGAAVNERHGTAYNVFKDTDFKSSGVKVYGKTGTTQNPSHAWFAGFAQDNIGRKLAIALVVEDGTSGSHDASPLAREILKLCVDSGFLGVSSTTAGEAESASAR